MARADALFTSMNQIQEKIRDLVDVRANEQLDDFLADLAQTLSGYYFTDITSDLMAKWIDRVVVMPTGSGNAYALAGYRGVGKSHFLAAFGAILSQPDLRARLKDSHVFASAERLIRRHYPVVYVRRGTKRTLIEEFQTAVASYFETDLKNIGSSPEEIVGFVSEKGGAGPSVIIVDTDLEREARVSRDDGGCLSDIAVAAEGTNVFVAVALDDDVAGADGRNSGISRSFTIDYLDHEHLYKIIDAHIFPKNNQRRSVITGIYENFRAVLPSFRWSEQRMASVYPLHPVILEVAPFVRLFIQDFALLAFASEAGAKILNRPADSLIALDQLFDTIEKSLRKSSDLEDLFNTYDSLNETVIGKTPVMERLRAKLVLKGLLLLSLDSEGATASDIAAAMLIFDERDTQSAVNFIESLLEKLVAGSEGRLWRMEREGRAVKYGFNLSGKEHFNTALGAAVQTVPDAIVPSLLKRLMRDRYGDCEFSGADDDADVAHTVIEWRGGVRRGRLIWNIGNRGTVPSSGFSHPTDWEILIDFEPFGTDDAGRRSFIQWRPDALKPEEFDMLKRYHALMSREDLQQTFRDEVRTAIQTYTIAIEKIWERKFLQYGTLLVDGQELKFSPQAAAGHNLSEVLGHMLDRHLERQFPEHPILGGRLEMESVDALATGLFAAREAVSAEVQKLAQAYAVPLGLAAIGESGIEVPPVEALLSLHPVSALMEMLATTDGPVAMQDLQARLGSQPFGLTFEAQCLVLTALVSRGIVEFVTKSSDRIGSRSLDLKLVWDDVAGIAMPAEARVSDDRLVNWAALLTDDRSLSTLGNDAARESVKNALDAWLRSWNTKKLLERLEQTPDDSMTTELWHLGARVRKSFGPVADAVGSVVAGTMDIENGLRIIQDMFSSSESEFSLRSVDMKALEEVLDAMPLRDTVRQSLALYGPTDNEGIEGLRNQVQNKLGTRSSIYEILGSREVHEGWNKFQSQYEGYFSEMHAASARSHDARDRAAEILASHEWWVYENLSVVEQLPTRFKRICREIMRELRRCNCTAEIVSASPKPALCQVCGFVAHSDRKRSRMTEHLWETVNQAIVAYDHVLQRMRDDVLEKAEKLASTGKDKETARVAGKLTKSLKDSVSVAAYSEEELRLLVTIFRMLESPVAPEPEIEESFTPVVTGEEIIEDAVVLH